MLRLLPFALTAALLVAGIAQGATFNYHGTLQDGGKGAEGSYDLELTLYTSPTGGHVVAGPMTVYGVPVHGGNFSTQVDFGALGNAPASGWLAVKIRAAGEATFAPLASRSEVAATTDAVCPGAWTTSGNAGTSPGTGLGQNYLGTFDDEPLVIAVNAAQVGRMTPSGDPVNHPNSPNVVFGSSGNYFFTDFGVAGATIAGGGAVGGSTDSSCGRTGNQPCVNSVGAPFGTVSGGEGNSAGGYYAAIGGGYSNTAALTSNIIGATIGGGLYNTATGASATICGGYRNTASGGEATVGGGSFNQAGGDTSFAAGHLAIVRDATATPGCTSGSCGDYGTFVWADSTAANFISTKPNQFLIRAAGNVGVNTNQPAATLDVSHGAGAGFAPYGLGIGALIESDTNTYLTLGSPAANVSALLFGNPTSNTAGAVFYNYSPGALQLNAGGATRLTLASNGQIGFGVVPNSADANLIETSANGAYLTNTGVWSNGSSRAFKEGFEEIDTGSILAKVIELPVMAWRYKQSEESHIGPTAEDFKAAFGLGSDAQHIGTVDEEGVALAAIQGLDKKEESDTAVLKRENEELRSQLEEVKARLAKLETTRGQ